MGWYNADPMGAIPPSSPFYKLRVVYYPEGTRGRCQPERLPTFVPPIAVNTGMLTLTGCGGEFSTQLSTTMVWPSELLPRGLQD